MRETPHLQYIRSEKEKGQKTKKEQVETVALHNSWRFPQSRGKAIRNAHSCKKAQVKKLASHISNLTIDPVNNSGWCIESRLRVSSQEGKGRYR